MHAFPLLSTRDVLLLVGGVIFAAMTACLASGQAADPRLEEPRGEASYYADRFAGRTTASGETYDPTALTAAHPSLPFGTRVRVERMGDDRAVTVRINDRGPFTNGRIIDLSKTAARRIGMIEEGVVEVRIEVLASPSNAAVTSTPSDNARRLGSRGGAPRQYQWGARSSRTCVLV